jgi:hypothetical protein
MNMVDEGGGHSENTALTLDNLIMSENALSQQKWNISELLPLGR